MADPATVIQVISASTSLVAQCAKVIKGLHDLAAKYKNAELSIHSIAHELDIIRLAWERIEGALRSWEGNENSDDELLQRLSQNLEFGALIVTSLAEDMSTFAKRPFTFTQRSKYVWSEEKFRDHQDRIRGQVLAMNLLVSVLKMPSAVERLSLLHNGAQVLRKSDESAYAIVPSRISSRLPSIYSNPSALSIESAELVYRQLTVDNDLFTARVYKRNYRHSLMNFRVNTRPSTSLRMRERAFSEDQSMFSHDREEERFLQRPHSTCRSILKRFDKFDRIHMPSSSWISGLPDLVSGKSFWIDGPAVSTDLVCVYVEPLTTEETRNLSESVAQCEPDNLAHLLRLLAWGFHSWRKWYLHQACNQKKVDLVQLLIDDDRSIGDSLMKDKGNLGGYHLDEGSLRLLRTKMGRDAVTDDAVRAHFEIACSQGQHQSVKSFLPYGLPANHDLLLAAASKLDYFTVEFLLDNGFDANAKLENGQTCLLAATLGSNYGLYSSSSSYWPEPFYLLRLTYIFLGHGADIEATTLNGNNFLHLAAQKTPWSVAEWHTLLISEAKLSSALAAVNQEGKTPAVVAEQAGNEEFLAFVDQVNPSVKDKGLSFQASCIPKGSNTIGQGENSAIGAEQLENKQSPPLADHVDQTAKKGTYSAPVSPQGMLSYPASRLPKGSEIDPFAPEKIRMKSPSRNSI